METTKPTSSLGAFSIFQVPGGGSAAGWGPAMGHGLPETSFQSQPRASFPGSTRCLFAAPTASAKLPVPEPPPHSTGFYYTVAVGYLCVVNSPNLSNLTIYHLSRCCELAESPFCRSCLGSLVQLHSAEGPLGTGLSGPFLTHGIDVRAPSQPGDLRVLGDKAHKCSRSLCLRHICVCLTGQTSHAAEPSVIVKEECVRGWPLGGVMPWGCVCNKPTQHQDVNFVFSLYFHSSICIPMSRALGCLWYTHLCN